MGMDFVKIKGYKSIKDIHLDLAPINILIGANGAGKSNFITFFELVNHIYEKRFQTYVAKNGGADKLLYQGAKETDKIVLELSFKNKINGYEANLDYAAGELIIMHEYLVYNGDKGRDIAYFLDKESNIKTTDNFRAKYVRNYLKNFRKYHFHDTSNKSPFTKMSHVDNDSYYLYEEGENLAAFLYNIRASHLKIYTRIVKYIQSIAPFFNDFFLEPNNEGYLRLQWQSQYSSAIYGVNDLSDGTLRFIALATLFMQPNLPSSIIIDEPELGLHPFAIAKLAGLINSIASKDTQVILATQSADLVNHFKAEDIVTVDMIDGASEFNRLNEEDLSQWLDEYSIGDLWQRSMLKGGQPNAFKGK